jgi:D-glycero-alpha-D-manno-heptose-7-phosphate kinase
LGKKITSPLLDKIYEDAVQAGAIGGKLLGAGGGGFFVFVVSPAKKHALIRHLVSNGLETSPCIFDPNGLTSWTISESREEAIKKQ